MFTVTMLINRPPGVMAFGVIPSNVSAGPGGYLTRTLRVTWVATFPALSMTS